MRPKIRPVGNAGRSTMWPVRDKSKQKRRTKHKNTFINKLLIATLNSLLPVANLAMNDFYSLLGMDLLQPSLLIIQKEQVEKNVPQLQSNHV
jgi:hypothetical protein